MKNTPYIATGNALNRRHFLKSAAGTFLGLPLLEAMTPTFGRAAANSIESPKRMVAMCATLGFHTPYLFPESPGSDYALTPYLQKLKDHRDDFTVFSGLSHAEQQGNNGHASEMTWLTSAKRPGLAGFKNTISLDQLIANEIGLETRFPYLALSTGGGSMSWTSTGVEIPAESSPTRLFKALFVNGSEKEIESDIQGFHRDRSVLDTVLGEAKKLERELGHRDKEKLEEYLTSVRDLEVRLDQNEEWARRTKPETTATEPRDIEDRNDAIGKQRLMNDMIVLALQSDSTRSITFRLTGMNAVPTIQGVKTDWHNLSHHGKDPAKIDELKIVEEAEFSAFNDFLSKLKGIEENGKSLLDHTSVLFGSNLGNASSHNWRNLPVILAGGGYRHGNYLAYDKDNNTPLSNLFVSLARQMGIDTEQFGGSTAAGVPGLETA